MNMNILYNTPKVSALNFMRYLFASLVKERNVIIDKSKIVETIFKFKSNLNPELRFLFDDIEFRECIDNVVSSDIDASINNLQTFGLIGKLNPSYDTMVIYLTEQDADSILATCDTNIKKAMSDLAISFGR